MLHGFLTHPLAMQYTILLTETNRMYIAHYEIYDVHCTM